MSRMSDFDYDCYQKKVTARSASKRVGQRKGCRLPSDNLTAAQIRKMSGEVESVNLSKPITWEEFKALPNGLQSEYLSHLSLEYGASIERISVELFGMSKVTLRKHAVEHNIDYIRVKSGNIPFEPEKWKEFLGAKNEEPIETETQEAEPEKETGEKATAQSGNLDNFSFIFSNVSDMREILALMGNLPLPKNARVYIEVERGEQDGD